MFPECLQTSSFFKSSVFTNSCAIKKYLPHVGFSDSAKRRSKFLVVQNTLRARFSVDVKFGCKNDVLSKLEAWSRDVGTDCGLQLQTVNILLGGSSRIDLELDVDDQQASKLFSAFHSPAQARWERSMEPLLSDSQPEPNGWTMLTLLPQYTPSSEPSSPLILPGSEATPEDASLLAEFNVNEPGSIELQQPSDPSSVLTPVNDPEEVAKILARDLRIQQELSKRTPGRIRNRMNAPPPSDDSDSSTPTSFPQGEFILDPPQSSSALPASNSPPPPPSPPPQPKDSTAAQADKDAEPPSEWIGDSRYEELRKNLQPGQRIARDWKGDPMIVNPGDNLPGI